MAWNGSSNEARTEDSGSPQKPRGAGRGTPGARHGLFAGLIVVAIGGAALWWFGRGARPDDAPDGARKAPGAISEAKPHIATNRVAEAPKPEPKPFSEWTDAEKLADIRAKYGNNIPDNLKPVVYYLEHPPKREFKAPPRPSHIFKRSSERQIAEMLMVEPGSWMLLKPQFNDRFDHDFAASLEEPIAFDKDDTDFQRELKQAVIDTKAELADRVRKGEKASEIMNALSGELYDLGKYRQEIEKMVREVKLNPKMTDSDVEDCVRAANEMLASKGIKPLSMPNMMFRQLALKRQEQKNKSKE